jgi:hypothetical protein
MKTKKCIFCEEKIGEKNEFVKFSDNSFICLKCANKKIPQQPGYQFRSKSVIPYGTFWVKRDW